jgi:hypothetical protein
LVDENGVTVEQRIGQDLIIGEESIKRDNGRIGARSNFNHRCGIVSLLSDYRRGCFQQGFDASLPMTSLWDNCTPEFSC